MEKCIGTAVQWLVLGMLPMLAREVEAGPAPAAEEVFARYEAAFNRYDADAVADFWVLDPATAERTLARWKGAREFEAATHATFRISARALGGDAFEVTQIEDNDFYRELGTGTKTSRIVIRLHDGRFHDVQPVSTSDALGDYVETKARFTAWIRENEPERAAEVLYDGSLKFNGATAGPIMDLVREWRADRRPEAAP